MSKLNIVINNHKTEAKENITVADLLKKHHPKGRLPAIAALVNNRLVGIYHDIRTDAEIKTIDMLSKEGSEVYRRTAMIIFFAAMRDVNPKAQVEVGQSIGNGYFIEIVGATLTKKFFKSLTDAMKQIVKKNLNLRPIWIPVEDAIKEFERVGRKDRVLLLNQLRKSEAQVVDILKYRGYVYGPVAPRTGIIKKFKLHKYKTGMVLEFPGSDGKFIGKVPDLPKLFSSYVEARRWNEVIGVKNVAQLNKHCIDGTMPEIIKVAEALHEKKIAEIAEEIVKRRNRRLILVAGPSSSGKTTFTKRLSLQLKAAGIEPISISIDNYYLDHVRTPRLPDGSLDLETIKSIDIKLFNKHLCKLLKGEEVKTPAYDFYSGWRKKNKHITRKLGPNQVLITEGLHGLNEKLTKNVEHKYKFKIYVSALTQLCIDDHNRIFTSDSRLLRRIVRDHLYRGSTAAATIAMWPRVRAGENKYIFPYQEEADVMFNSALVYEAALLKPYAMPFLMEVPMEHPSFVESLRLIRFLDLLIPVLQRDVPHMSILREFIGGSAFRY